MTHDELVEKIAQAIRDDPICAETGDFDACARAAIATILAALREVTPAVIEAALNADSIPAENSDEFLALDEDERDRAWWRGQIAAAIDASPLAPEGRAET